MAMYSSKLCFCLVKVAKHNIVAIFFDINEMGDIIDTKSQMLLEFDYARIWLCIPPNYAFVW